MTPPTRLICECDRPNLGVHDFDGDRVAYCSDCGRELVSNPVAQAIRLVQLAVAQGIRVDAPTIEAAPAAAPTNGKPALDGALALTRVEAAKALRMGTTSFDQYVRPHVRAVRRGKLRCYPVDELRRWLDENAERALP